MREIERSQRQLEVGRRSESFLVTLRLCSMSGCCFFFSSRRRHTRSDRDWSSDVCSSDLPPRWRNCWNRISRSLKSCRRAPTGFASPTRSHGRCESLSFRQRRRVRPGRAGLDRKSTRLNSSHDQISYAVFCLKKKNSTLPLLSAFDSNQLKCWNYKL